MTLGPQVRRNIGYAIGIMAAWVMLWDQVTVPNAVAGLVVAVVLLSAFPLRDVRDGDHLTLHPVAFVRLAAAVLWQLAVSTVLVAREVVSPRARLRTGIVGCRMRTSSPKLLSTVANILALSPGTLAVDAVDAPPTLYVHVLSLDDVIGVRRRVARLERQVIEAIGSPRHRRELALSSGSAGSTSGGVRV
jgi:multicomponent Na+:H+ antiporter subunit E